MPEPIQITDTHKKESGIINALTSTLRRLSGSLGFGVSPDGKRDYNALFGYGTGLCYSDYYGMYDRSALANAIVEKIAKACWNEIPKLMSGDVEILETELAMLGKMGFFAAIERADILNRIGNFSILVIQLPDGMDLDKPLAKAGKLEKLFFQPYNYDGITITKWDDDPASERYMMPEIYQVQTSITGDKSKDIQFKAFNVHYSRIIHLAEGKLDSNIEGRSALRAPWNAIIDAEKVRGGSGEAYFRNARQQRSLEADKDARLEPGSEASASLKENIEAFDNGWESTLRLQNMTAKNMTVEMISPRDTFDIIVETISGQTGIPIRILTGKGGGSTTGTEDRASWNAVIADRRASFCDGVLFQGLDILNDAGMIDLPEDAIIEWQPQIATTEKEDSENKKRKAETFNIIVDALGKPVGDEADITTVLEAVGLGDIEIDESNLDIDEPEPDADLNEPD